MQHMHTQEHDVCEEHGQTLSSANPVIFTRQAAELENRHMALGYEYLTLSHCPIIHRAALLSSEQYSRLHF